MEILKFPHPILFEKCSLIPYWNDSEVLVLLDQMWETMKKYQGIGLAANQVGLPFRMFIMEGPNKEKFYIIDPKIVAKSIVPANLREGCLSAPEEFISRSDRAEWVQVAYSNADGTTEVRVFHGLHAVCVQHEIEHLDGISYLQSKTIPKKQRLVFARKWGLK